MSTARRTKTKPATKRAAPKEAVMTTVDLNDPKKTVAEHLEKLRHYAQKVLLLGETLTEEEAEDRTRRMLEFQAIGNSFKLTNREMAVVLYKGILTGKRACGCPTCRPKSAA